MKFNLSERKIVANLEAFIIPNSVNLFKNFYSKERTREMEEEKQQAWNEMPLEEHMAHYEAAGMDRKEAMKQVAKDRGLKKRDIYQLLLENKEDSRD